MKVSLAIVGSRSVFPSIAEIDREVVSLLWSAPANPLAQESFETILAIVVGEIVEVVDGMADGGDYAGRLWAEHHKIAAHDEPILAADIERWGKYVGPKVRNARVADRATHGLAFWDGKSNGTTDFVTRMRLRKKPVDVVKAKAVPGMPKRPRPARQRAATPPVPHT
jgi:hypothetical protein